MDSQRVSTTNQQLAESPVGPDGKARPKKPYRRPQLLLWGDLRDLTLGPSPGIGESGNPALFKA